MAEYTAAVIGCGSRGRDHVEAYEHVDRGRVVACAAPSPEHREPLAGEFDLAAYGDIEELLVEESPDLVHITTPPDVRVEVMRPVSEAEVPACTVEKPIALGVADWRDLRDLESRTNTAFAVCHQFRWHPDLVRCRDGIGAGTIGDVRFLEASARLEITDQGTHCLHYANSLNGDARIESVFGTASGPFRADQMHPGPAATGALVTFENGARCQWTTGTAAPRVAGRDEEYQHKRAVAHGDEGRARWEQFGEWGVVGTGGRLEGAFGGMDRRRRRNREAQVAFHEAMLDWIEDDDARPGTHLERSLHEWKAVLALYASALRNERIFLDEFRPEGSLVATLRAELSGPS